MLTTIIYRSHICDNVSFKSIEAMVARANERNGQAVVGEVHRDAGPQGAAGFALDGGQLAAHLFHQIGRAHV